VTMWWKRYALNISLEQLTQNTIHIVSENKLCTTKQTTTMHRLVSSWDNKQQQCTSWYLVGITNNNNAQAGI